MHILLKTFPYPITDEPSTLISAISTANPDSQQVHRQLPLRPSKLPKLPTVKNQCFQQSFPISINVY